MTVKELRQGLRRGMFIYPFIGIHLLAVVAIAAFGAKEAGETSLAAFIPALTNAIADAIGVRPMDLPVTPDRLMALIEKAEFREAAE